MGTEGTYKDKKCPFTGHVNLHRRIITGVIKKKKMQKTIIVRRNHIHYNKKYRRYEKRHSNIPAHISPCFSASAGDFVVIGKCRPLSKSVRYNVLRVLSN